MNWLIVPVYVIHVVTSLFLILVVLLQQGRGADLSVFGGGSTQAAFGARGATLLIHKLTVGSFVMFIVTTLAIGVFSGRQGHAASLMEDAEAVEEVEGEPAASPTTAPDEADPAAAEATATSGDEAAAAAPARDGEAGAGPESETFTPPAESPQEPAPQ